MHNDPAEVEAKRPVSKPQKPLPSGSWDCHTHIFGPYEQFPLYEKRGYQPPLATCVDYLAMLETVGFERGVIVHPGASGWDNAATSHATSTNWPRLRGVGVLPSDLSIEELKTYHDDGMRGMRISVLPIPGMAGPGVLGREDIAILAPKFKELGWHFNIWATPDVTIDEAENLVSYDVPVILDHMGFFDVKGGADGEAFQTLLSVIADNNFYVKMTPNRVSPNFPDFEEVRPFWEAYAKRIPDQIVFGSDWPFIAQGLQYPDVGKMVDLVDSWVGDDTVREKLFVKNPERFYAD